LALVVLLSSLMALAKLYDPDFWWHLATGRQILHEGLFRTNTFSGHFADHPYGNTEWLFDLLLYALYGVFGYAGCQVAAMALSAGSWLLAALTVRRSGGVGAAAFLPLAALGLAASWIRLTPRPHLVTYLGLALLLYLQQARPRREVAWHALLAMVWANCHAGVLFGVALLGLKFLEGLLLGDRQAWRRNLKLTGAFLIGSLVNPGGPGLLWYPFLHFNVTDMLPVTEFMPMRLASAPAFALYLALALLALPARVRRRDYFYPMVLVVFLLLTFRAVRIAPKFILVTMPGLGVTLAEWGRGASRLSRGRLAPWALSLALALSVVPLAVLEHRGIAPVMRFGWGVPGDLVPEGAVGFVREESPEGPFYNDFNQGGYLIWRLFPGYRVFQDGRIPAYPAGFLEGIYRAFQPDDPASWGRLMETYGLRFALVDRMPFGGSLDAGLLFDRLGWTLVYLDGASLVYVRPGGGNDRIRKNRGFDLIGWRDPPEVLHARGVAQPALMRAELARIDPGRMIIADDFRRFAAAALGAGDRALAQVFLGRGLGLYPGDRTLEELRLAMYRMADR
jgi:hypothetical protein